MSKLRKLADLKKLEGNPRIIKKDDMAKLVESIKNSPDYFEARPIILSDRTGELVILGGNQRYEAAKIAGLEEVPTHLIENLTEDREREIIIRDNVSNGEWDWSILANEWEVSELEDWGLDLPVDFSEDKEVEEDEAPEVSSEPAVSKLGEIYQLGRHRVMCGSATELDSVVLLADGNKADLILTDPPYNMAYTGSATARREAIINDKIDNFGEFVNDFMASMVAVAKTSAPYYVFTSEPEVQTIKSGFVINGLKPHQTLIWKKHRFGFGGADYQHQYEPFVYGWNSHKERYMVNKRNLSDIWEFDRPTTSELHPTMKPIALLAYALNNSSKTDDIVLDLFLGSGSTLIACEQTDRTCYGMELDPKYVDVIRKRYAKFVNGELPDNWQELTPEVQ